MILVLIVIILVPFPAGAHNFQQRQEVSENTSLARQLLQEAKSMIYPSHLEALLEIGKLQAKAGDDPGAQATFEQIERQIRVLPLRSEIPTSEGEFLARDRYEYYLRLATAQWESGYTEPAVKAIGLAQTAIQDIQRPTRRYWLNENPPPPEITTVSKVAALGELFLTQARLELPFQTVELIELLDQVPPKDPIWGSLIYEKVDALLSIARALHDNGNNEKATQLLHHAQLKIEEMDDDLSRSRLMAPLIGMLLRTGHRSMWEKKFHEEVSRLNEPSPHTDNPMFLFEKTLFLIEMGKALYDVGDSAYSHYINQALAATRNLSPEHEWIRSSALQTIARTMVTLGEIDGALAIEKEIVDEGYKNQSLPEIAEALIANGEFARAITLAHKVRERDPPRKAFILSQVSKVMAKKGDITSALKIASQIGFPYKAGAYVSIAEGMVHTQSLEKALALAEQQSEDYYKVYILMGIAKGLLDQDGGKGSE
jgi:tetratricopeptide (TPR) repeat protein